MGRVQRHWLAITVAVAVILVAIVLAYPILTGAEPGIFGFGGSYWRKLIYDFQTLLAGFLAILAAAGTVIMMDHTERKQADRHIELVRLQTRADKLTISRAANPQLEELPDFIENISSLSNQFSTNIDAARLAIYEDPGNYARLIDDLRTFLKRQVFEECRPLFDGDTAYSYARVLYAAENLSTLWGGYQSAIQIKARKGHSQAQILNWLHQDDAMSRNFLQTLEEHLCGFQAGLKQLAKQYGV